jgi:hypothetical protein
MSKSCSHRHIVGTLVPGADEYDTPLTIVAIDSCGEAKRYIEEQHELNPELRFEISSTRAHHWIRWTVRKIQKEAREHGIELDPPPEFPED